MKLIYSFFLQRLFFILLTVFLTAFFLFTGISCQALTHSPEFDHILAVQEQLRLRLAYGQNSSPHIHIGSQKTLKAKAIYPFLYLWGIKEGRTELNIDNKKMKIHIISREKMDTLEALSQLEKKLNLSLSLTWSDHDFKLTAEILRYQTWLSLKQAHDSSPYKWTWDLKISQALLENTRFKIQSHNPQLKDLGCWSKQGFLFFDKQSSKLWEQEKEPEKMKVKNQTQANKQSNLDLILQKELLSWGFQVMPLTLSPQVLMELKWLEVSKPQNKNKGFNWPKQLIWNGEQGWLWNQLEGSIQSQESVSFSKSHHSTQTHLNLNKETVLSSGGEFPYESGSKYYKSIQWKNYGWNLKAQLESLYLNTARIKISMNWSELQNIQPGLPPQVLSKSYSQSLDVKLNQPHVLMTKETASYSNGNSGLGPLHHIPLLGQLFKSRSLSKGDSIAALSLQLTKTSFCPKQF